MENNPTLRENHEEWAPGKKSAESSVLCAGIPAGSLSPEIKQNDPTLRKNQRRMGHPENHKRLFSPVER
jgi:hypothetical protein